MARKPQRYSRLSVGWANSSQSLADVDAADTGVDFSCINGAATGTWAQTGAATFSSTATFSGNVTATGGLFVGDASAVNEVVAVSSTTAAVSLGAINPNEASSVVTVGLSGATRGDTLFLTLDSIYQDVAGNRNVTWHCSSSSTVGEVNVWGSNVSIAAITPTANTVIRLTRINHPSYI